MEKEIRMYLVLLLTLIFPISCNSQVINNQDSSGMLQEHNAGYPANEPKNPQKNNLLSPDDYLYPSPEFSLPRSNGVTDQFNTIEPLKPSDGKASISGMIYSFTSKMMLPETKIFLTKALGVENSPPPVLMSPDESIGDIIGWTQMDGQFQINDIPPGKYYLIVWGPDVSSIVVNLSSENYSPLLFTLLPNGQYNLGVLNVSWP